MSPTDRKDLTSGQARLTAAANTPAPSVQEAELRDEERQQTFSNPDEPVTDEPLAPFAPARGAVLDGGDVESVRSADNEIEPSMAANADIENVAGQGPDQIDPGADGNVVI